MYGLKVSQSQALGLATVRVLVIGAGAREHALLLALRNDPEVKELAIAPGNAGTAAIADQYDVDITSGDAVAALARKIEADLVVIGPEVPLVVGVADAVRAVGIACFGPTKEAARVEGSKSFAKDVMAAAGVRTATSEIIDNPGRLDAALDRFGPDAGNAAWVVKDDGLAAGKGVVVTADRDAARAHAASLLDAGHPVLLESFLDGPEVSLFCVVDGETVVPLLAAQDFKRVGDGDTGPNTGGMGAYAPLPWLPDDVVRQIVGEIVKPVAAELVKRGSPFSGLLYAGLAITSQGPAVVEFNCRFGDPETQSVLALLDSPLGQLLYAAATGHLAEHPPLRWRDGAAVTVVLAAENYPGRPRVGDVIAGADTEGVLHAGTARRDDGAVVSSGGRVLSVVGTGPDLAAAREDAYRRISAIKLPGSHFRSDIALAAAEGRISLPTG
ncbi:phosphoribosylamine--glycine ligase [Mycolicibacterium agri]|uniref:Phosphoribosylamine--glycine ligase n=1 Tax=Mycolicibacterium agri TaxID=36811 RepID=A0A7I9W9C9_MYCAG|nr:phosphoribosylamine--glycine ligase [Mycolicibacterium agri]